MKLSDIKIRLINVSDAEAYDAFMVSMFAENLDTLPQRNPATNLDLLIQYIKKCAGEHSALFVAETNGRLISGIGISRVDLPNRSHTSVLGMNVAGDYRGKGLGRSMLEHALDWADSTSSIERIELEVTSQNASAIHLYEAFGFKSEGIKRRAMKKKDKYIDLLLMARMLNSTLDTVASRLSA